MAATATASGSVTGEAPSAPPFPDMVWIPSTTFRMGSDKHYPEEKPVHRVLVDGFWIDRYPVSNQRCVVRPTDLALARAPDESGEGA